MSIVGILILAIILGLTIYVISNLYNPNKQETISTNSVVSNIYKSSKQTTSKDSAVYAICDGERYNLNQKPFACDTVNSGYQACYHTFTANKTEFIQISQTPENETC